MNTRNSGIEYDRTALIVILFCMTVVIVGSILGISYLFEYNFYESGDGGATAKSIAVQIYSNEDLDDAKDYYDCVRTAKDNYRINYYQDRFSPQKTSFVFCVTDVYGNPIFTNLGNTPQDLDKAAEDYKFAVYNGSSNYFVFDPDGNTIPLKINYYISSDSENISGDKYSVSFKWIEIANDLRFFLFVALAAAIVIMLIILSVITINAGVKENNKGEIVMSFIDRVPLDICAAFLIFSFWVAWLIIGITAAADVNMVVNNIVIVITSVAMILILMTFLSTLSVRIKIGKALKNTLVYRICKAFKRKTPRKIRKRLFVELTMFQKLIIGIVVFILFEAVILLFMTYFGLIQKNADVQSVFVIFLIVWSITRLLIVPIFAMIAINLNYVKEEGQRLAQGVFGDEIADKLTIAAFKAHGQNLDKIKKEINKAMAQELKSEKLKSELITNVSHDIKTPLTSIKNYVDFLKSDSLTEEQKHKYLEILTAHTEKLDLLLNNLIEASRINSGSIDINLEKTSLNILIEQTVEESADRLEKSELLPRIVMPQEDIYIMGDGQWLWRILANLMNNACKYASPGTDVLIELSEKDGKAVVLFENESKNELNIEGNELKERFIRGDSSRHSEGFGLGLSIANSLTEMQNGKMDISVFDGKFTVTLEFDSIQ